jgi:hypothetical protein
MNIADLANYFYSTRRDDNAIEEVVDDLPVDFHSAYGETRWAIWCDGWDFVIKIPRYGYASQDYCQVEMHNYERACAYGIERVCLPLEVVFTNVYGLTFYKQTRYSMSTADGNRKDYRKYLIKRHIEDIAGKKLVNVARESCYKARLDRYWTSRVIQLYGKKFMRSFESWTQECKINDLHNGNTGWLNHKPILLDYAGYHD